MPGELREYKNEAYKRAMTAPIIQEEHEDLAKKLRDKGLI
jgi:hypothetical protein